MSPDADPREWFTAERSGEIVAASLEGTPDPRLRAVLQSLVRHLHDFVKEVELSGAEWEQAIEFLTATGHMSDETRQEFILLSDVLGLSMLVETINHPEAGVTESTVLGPFHMVQSPPLPLGANISQEPTGEPCVVSGQVVSSDGRPIPGASIDVWQADADGFYDVQKPGVIPPLNLRGLFTADDRGRFWFRTIVPRYYPVPDDGPVGALLAATARHPFRPAHIHFLVHADGYQSVATHVFADNSPYLDSDVVFGVKASLVRAFAMVDNEEAAARIGLANPYRAVEFEIRLAPKEPSND